MSQIDDFLNGTSAPQAPAGQPSQIDAFLSPPPKKRNPAAFVNDTVIEAVNAAVGGVSAAANFVRPGNALSSYIDRNIQAGEASQSDAVKAEKQRFRQDVASAGGVMDEVGAVGRYVVNNPVQAAAQAVGSFVGPGAAVKGGRTLASMAGLNAARGGLAGGAAAGAAMAGGDAAGTAYELSTKGGATDEQAVAAGRQASVLPAVIGGLGGVVGAERLVAGAKGFTGNAVSRALKTGAVEGAQEGIEEGVTQYEGQRAAMPYDKTIDPTKGVAAAAAMGAALGGATGGGVSLLTGGHSAPAPAPGAQSDPNALRNDAVTAQPQRPSEAMGINPDDGVMSRAAALAADMELAPVPAAPTPQEQRTQLEETISRLPEDQQREARVELADADNQALPAGVRALRSERVQELADAAPASAVDLAPGDMERGRVLQNFDARQPDMPPLADYAPLIEQAIKPEYRAEYQNLLATATDTARSSAERDTAAEVLHATFSPDQLQRARSLRPTPDTRLELQDTAPARYGNEIDFEQAPIITPGPDAMAERINQLALDADLTPGQPLQLNQAHALRRRGAEQGITMSVIPHASGRGYDVAPTSRLDPAARAAMPQEEAAAQLPFDQSVSGRMLAGQDGSVRAETRPEAVALSNAAAAQRQQVETERQRRAELGLSNITPVTRVQEVNPINPPLTFDNAPTGRMVAGADGVRQEGRAEAVNRANAPAPAPQTVASASGAPFPTQQAARQELQRQQLASTHQVVPAGGDESLGFVLREKGRNQPAAPAEKAQAAINPVADRAPNWRSNAMQANRVARGLGIDTKGKRLAQVVAEIDAADVRSRMSSSGVATTTMPPTESATEMVAAGADVESAGRPSTAAQGDGHQQVRPPRPGPRQESTQKQAPALDSQALVATKSGADSTSSGPGAARAPAPRSASWMFHHAEKFNRQITFVAAYRLAREAGAGDKAAYEQAVQATYDGHFDYSSNNRPRAMQGNVARVVLLFKQYGQNMVYTLVRNAHQSLKGATPAERAQARKALGGLLTMHGLAAGALGLPMVTTLLAAASMLGGDDDEPWDAQVALQNMLADTFGQKPAEVLAHGLSRLTPWDISGRVGLDKLIFPDVQEGLEGQRLAESAMTASLGPVAGIGINVLKGVQEMSEGRYLRGLETMAPSVARGPLKAWRYGDEGVRDKSGIVVQDEVDAAALIGQVGGFSPSSVRNAFEGKSAIVQHDRALQARRSALVEQFAMAAMAGDEEGKAAAREDIARFNEKNPNRRIQAMQLAQSVHQREKRIRDAKEGVYLPSKRRDAMEAGRFAVPD